MDNIFYIHNPITYSISKEIIKTHLSKDNNFLIFGRQMRVPNAEYVNDDGIWNTERSLKFLQATLNSGFNKNIQLYIPHTAFLFGKLIKNIENFEGYYYIEEGRHSTNLAQNSPSNELINELELENYLKAFDLNTSLEIPTNIGALINSQDNNFYDPNHKKYKGCYFVTETAFQYFENRKRVRLTSSPKESRKIHFKNKTLVILPSFIELFGVYQDKFLDISKVIIVIIKYLNEANKQLVIKSHPQDHQTYDIHNTFKYIFDSIYENGINFEYFNFENKVDKFSELALLGFENYIVFGNSSATDYLQIYVDSNSFKSFSFSDLMTLQKAIN